MLHAIEQESATDFQDFHDLYGDLRKNMKKSIQDATDCEHLNIGVCDGVLFVQAVGGEPALVRALVEQQRPVSMPVSYQFS